MRRAPAAVRIVAVVLALVAADQVLATAPALERIEDSGRVDAVTVYRGQALVTRVIEVPGPAGLREIVVSNLPPSVVSGSIHAESADSIEVRSLRYSSHAIEHDVRGEVRELDAAVRALEDDLARNESRLALLGQHGAFLGELDEFTAVTATDEIERSVLEPDSLRTMAAFLFDERGKLGSETFEIQLAQRSLRERLDVVQRERQAITDSSSRTAREALVFVSVSGADGGTLRLRYLVDDASWSPSYGAHTASDRGHMVIEYHAQIEQRSGEAWDDVEVTLSTATPTLAAKAPDLPALDVVLRSIAPEGVFDPGLYAQNRQRIEQEQWKVDNQRAQRQVMELPAKGEAPMPVAGEEMAALDDRLNSLACELQLLELAADIALDRDGARAIAAAQRDESLSVTYALPARIALPSRAEQQLVRIATIELEAESYKLATPVLTGFVYDETSAVNTSGLVLLAGPLSSYFGGHFVGHGELATIAAGERFSAGFGIDSSLRARRELVTRSERVQAGNRVVDLTYRLTVENFADRAVDVRLIDRMPIDREGEVEVSLITSSAPESEDRAYLEGGKQQGILRFDVTVPAKANGSAALAIEYQIRLQHDRQMTIAGLGPEA